MLKENEQNLSEENIVIFNLLKKILINCQSVIPLVRNMRKRTWFGKKYISLQAQRQLYFFNKPCTYDS